MVVSCPLHEGGTTTVQWVGSGHANGGGRGGGAGVHYGQTVREGGKPGGGGASGIEDQGCDDSDEDDYSNPRLERQRESTARYIPSFWYPLCLTLSFNPIP